MILFYSTLCMLECAKTVTKIDKIEQLHTLLAP